IIVASRNPAYEQWEIWEVEWKHEDGTSKNRPALLISESDYNRRHDHCVFVKISTKDHPARHKFELSPTDGAFVSTGLKKRSFFYLKKVQAISKDRIISRRGSLSRLTAFAIQQLLNEA